jgi:type IV pilus assembly protein PilA
LIELLVVFVIIGILASIALDVFLDQRRKGWDAAVLSDVRNASTAQETVLAGSPTGQFATDMGQLLSAGFRPSAETNYFGKTFAMTIEANGGLGYCLTARSESGRYFGFSSDRGFVSQPGALNTTTCS